MNQQYEIVFQGHLSPRLSVIFEGMEVSYLTNGKTRLVGSLPDQSALYGLLVRLRDLGIQLISINSIGLEENNE
jgi:hypothetical protein